MSGQWHNSGSGWFKSGQAGELSAGELLSRYTEELLRNSGSKADYAALTPQQLHTHVAAIPDPPHSHGLSVDEWAKKQYPQGAVARMGSQLPQETSELPVAAWRAANLRIRNKTLELVSLNHGPLAIDGVAECSPRTTVFVASSWQTSVSPGFVAACDPAAPETKTHPAPDPDCTCGFYGVTDESDADTGAVMLEVEFSGRIVVHEKGYRAERQRVLRVHVLCCSHALCKEPSVGLDEDRIGWCSEHKARRSNHWLCSLSKMEDLLGVSVVSDPYKEPKISD